MSSFTGNKANLGGAIYVAERVAADISYSTFTLNLATSGQFGQGGAIFIRSSTTATATSVSISNADVNGNAATDRGGGIFVSAVESGTGTELSVAQRPSKTMS